MSSGREPNEIISTETVMATSAAVFSNNSSLSSTSNGTCTDREDSLVIILSSVPLLALLFNILVLVAVILHRSKLRQNNVYVYVFSVLLSNILFNTLVSYQMINHYYQFEGNPTTGSSALRNWWVFRKSLLPSTYLIMIANIGALIFAIQSGNEVVAKAANAQTWNGRESAVSSIQKQQKRTKVIVSLAWILPLTLTLFTLTGWNCGETCVCLSGCYTIHDMEKHHTRACSRVLSSVSNSYMGVIAALWVVEIAVLLFTICKTFSHSLLLSAGCLARDESAEDKENVAKVDIDQVENEESPTDSPSRPKFKRSDLPCDNEKSRSRNRSRRSRRADRRQRRYAKWLRQASKQLAYLTVLFFVCTFPSVIWFVLDIFEQKLVPSTTSNILISLPIVYSIVCPLVLAKDLAGLKSAILSLILKLFPARRTKRNSGTYTTSSLSDHENGQK